MLLSLNGVCIICIVYDPCMYGIFKYFHWLKLMVHVGQSHGSHGYRYTTLFSTLPKNRIGMEDTIECPAETDCMIALRKLDYFTDSKPISF